MLKIRRYQPEDLDAMARFAAHTWDRPNNPAFARWRYQEAPGRVGYVAVRDGEIVAALDGFVRTYRVGTDTVPVYETLDWYCLPELRRSGLGVRVMRLAMKEHPRIVATGGTEDTRSLLPRLRWVRAGSVGMYTLPLGGPGITRVIEQRTGLPRSLVAPAVRAATETRARWQRGLPRPLFPGLPPDLRALYRSAPRLAALPDEATVRWLMAGHTGTYIPVHSADGWVLARLYRTKGALVAKLVEAMGSPAALPALLGETIMRLLPFRPERVYARASWTPLRKALERQGFVAKGESPAFAWADAPLPPGERHWTLLSGDGALLPYR